MWQSVSFCEDDKTAAWLESQQHLQLWMGDKEEDLWIDRYDVRLLLSDVSLFARSVRTWQQFALCVRPMCPNPTPVVGWFIQLDSV